MRFVDNNNYDNALFEMAQLKYANGNFVVIDDVKIFINAEDHNPPHIHGKWKNKDIYVDINTYESKFSNDKDLNKKKKSIIDWMMRNQNELLKCFEDSKNNPKDVTIYQRNFNESISVDDDLCSIVPIIDVDFYDDENIIVTFNCGFSMLYNINMIPSLYLREWLINDKDLYYNQMWYGNYMITWDDDGVDAFNVWEDGEIM